MLPSAVMRFDVVLHELRLFKSRAQASSAIVDGRALLNGRPARPSRSVRPGDWITLSGLGRSRTLEVLELPAASLSKADARRLLRQVTET